MLLLDYTYDNILADNRFKIHGGKAMVKKKQDNNVTLRKVVRKPVKKALACGGCSGSHSDKKNLVKGLFSC